MIARVLLILALLTGGAFAQGPILPGPGLPVAAAALPTATYIGQTGPSSGTGTTTITITGANIGNPAYISTRRVIIAITGLGNSAAPVSGTINGVSLDQLTALTGGGIFSNEGVDFVSAPVPSGTTGVTISITFAFSVGSPSFMIFNVDGSLLSSTTPVTGFNNNNSTLGTVTTTVNTTTKSGGFILAANWCGGGAGPSITASTETYTTDYSNSANFAAHANGITSNASNSVSTQCPPAGGSTGLGLAAWR